MSKWHWTTPDQATTEITGMGLLVIAGIFRDGKTWRSYCIVDGTYDCSNDPHETPEEAAMAALDAVMRMAIELMRIASEASYFILPPRPEEVKP